MMRTWMTVEALKAEAGISACLPLFPSLDHFHHEHNPFILSMSVVNILTNA
jgi:hypothetical protein